MGEEDQLIAERYRLVARLGRGGMGEVWQAYDERLHRKVAVKRLLMPDELNEEETETARRRAVREARIAAQLQHRNVIAVFDVLELDGPAYLILEFLPSRSLSQVIGERGTLPPDEVARIGAQIADGLEAAHAAGIVHRDVKPGNVLLGDDGTAKITDFGISRAIEDVGMTSSGLVVGTPAYMSPEVAQGENASFASDVFSLGATLCMAVDGKPPVGQSDNAIALLYRAASGDITVPAQAGPMVGLLERMLSTDPAGRPPMSEVRQLLTDLPVVADEPTVHLAAVPAPAPLPAAPPAQAAAPSSPAPSQSAPAETAPAESAPADEAATPAPAPDRRKRRTRALVAALVAAFLVAGGVVALLWNQDDPPGQAAAPPASQTSSPVSTEPSAPAQQPASSTGESQAPQTPPPPANPPANPPPQQPVTTSTGGAAVITGYYALMPGNLDAAWTRLTPKYQQSPAGGRSGYQRYWDRINGVQVSQVNAQSQDVVEATVEYRFKDGRVIVERHRYFLIQQDGQWKIDRSTVLSSRTLGT